MALADLWGMVVTKATDLTASFQHPSYLIGIPIIFIFLVWLLTRSFVRYSMDEQAVRRMRRTRVFVLIMRFIALSLLIIALATPFTEITQESDGNPHAVILLDKSGSMDAYDTSFVPQLTAAISAQLPTSVKEFGSPTESPIGDAVLGQQEHILLISDGNANTGVNLLDVAQVARENNKSINTIKLSPIKDDSAVFIDAPTSVPVGYPVNLVIDVTSTAARAVPTTVLVDGQQVYDAPLLGSTEISPTLSPGYHKIEAHIQSSDSVSSNNDFYRVVQVTDKPKILVVARQTGTLEQALAGLFDTTVVKSMPSDETQLSQYYAVVLDDTPASSISGAGVNALASFLRDEEDNKYGNGLVVVGGFNSFDRGGYGGTQLEGLLPIKVGKAKKNLGQNNIVFVIQVSGSTSGTTYTQDANGQLQAVTSSQPTIDTIKAQAVSAINSINLQNNVGVVAFGVVPQDAQSCAGKGEDCIIGQSVVKIADVKPLYSDKQTLVDEIPRITGGGTTAPDIALKAAVDMLKDKTGTKTIIFLTNGRFCAGLGACANTPEYQNVINVVQMALRYGIHTQTIGVGSSDPTVFPLKVDEATLTTIAQAGDSTYDRATNMASLIINYGDPKEKGFGEAFNLVLLSLTHPITKDVTLDAVLNGYNEVAPKDGSRLLVSTDAGDPALTVWNYFNGRVATITVFTTKGLGPLLAGNNSDLVRNTVLWAVGDPMRKQDVRSDIPMAIVGQSASATFISKSPISGACQDTPLNFERSSGDTYIFSFTPGKAGFGSACGIPYAVNGESEYWHVGINPDLATAVGISNGGEFTADQIDQIVERIKTVSTKVTVEKTEVRNPFIALAIIIFLLEIFIRRMTQYRKN